MGSIPRSGGSPGVGNGNPLQYSCLENSMDRGAWQAMVHSVAQSRTRLSMHTCTGIINSHCGYHYYYFYYSKSRKEAILTVAESQVS